MNTIYWLALSFTPGIGGVTTRNLLQRFGDIESIFNASPEEIASIPRISITTANRLLNSPFDQLEAELVSLNDEGIELLTWDDDQFPNNLRSLHDAPFLLFMRGTLIADDLIAVAIVGSRQATEESANLAETLGREFADRRVTVVSGLAEGVDTAAHQGTLSIKSGRTIAVLGSGIRVIHPQSNSELADRIISSGALLSEFHPNAPPRGQQLMARDRIISGLSKAVIIVEAGENSGSLDTAARAKKQGRPVYAVPGSSGTNQLIEEGAQVIDPARISFQNLIEEISRPQDTFPNLKPKQGSLF